MTTGFHRLENISDGFTILVCSTTKQPGLQPFHLCPVLLYHHLHPHQNTVFSLQGELTDAANDRNTC